MGSLIYRGSVKDIYQDNNDLIFKFSDRYSIFDWGEMPDLIPGKGLSLAKMTRAIYQELGQRGVRHHLLPPLNETESAALRVQKFSLFKANYDPAMRRFHYTKPKEHQQVALPLEVVFRYAVVVGSSFVQRSQDLNYLMTLGYSQAEASQTQNVNLKSLLSSQSQEQIQGYKLPRPVVEFFTKLEPQDRRLSYEEAAQISGLSLLELESLAQQTLQVADHLQNMFQQSGIELWDGKLEWAMDSASEQNTWVLMDSIGPDEIRISYQGVHLSKELLRSFYRATPWYKQLQKAKAQAEQEHNPEWKSYLQPEDKPEQLPADWLQVMSNLYQTLAEVVSPGSEVLKRDKLDQIVLKLRELMR